MASAAVTSEVPGTVPKSRRGRPRGQYKCQYCGRIFKCSEHCIRHERIHPNEKTFSCRYCKNAYSRKDLVTRHERTLHAREHHLRLQQPEAQQEESQQDEGDDAKGQDVRQTPATRCTPELE
ncbi:hypothetical protein NW759_012350 [Fusarium solani]|nr:hypothetical protein NW759_012350 [Fusarium solani]